MMICDAPRRVSERIIISAYDAVWEPAREISPSLKCMFTDDLGNEEIRYLGWLQPKYSNAFDRVDDELLFSCIRMVRKSDIGKTDVVPNTRIHQENAADFVRVGWDICNGNGWVSASLDGDFPINPISGEVRGEGIEMLNGYSLFERLEDCDRFCDLNNEPPHESPPWYVVGVYLTSRSLGRL